MSIRVAVDDLQRVVACFGWGYLVSVGGERPQIEAQPITWQDGALHIAGIGQTSMTNIIRKPQVTLVFPPGAAVAEGSIEEVPAGFTLIVDGAAEIAERAKRTAILVRPSSAVFHRPAAVLPAD